MVSSHVPPDRAVPSGEHSPQLRMLLMVAAVGMVYATVTLAFVVFDPVLGKLPKPPDLGNTIFEPEGAVALAFLAGLVCWMIVAAERTRLPPAADQPLRVAVCVSALLSASIGVTFLTGQMTLTALTGTGAPPSTDKQMEWVYSLLMISWLVALLVLGVAALLTRAAGDPARAHRRRRAGRVTLAVVLLLPLAWPTLLVLGRAVPIDVLACTGTTAFALWAVHGMQRHRRMPFRVLLGGFGWGALIGVGFGFAQNNVTFLFVPGIVRSFEAIRLIVPSLAPAFFEEVGKVAGVVVLALLARRWVDNVASGVVLGASVGLGFNFVESLLYMDSGPAFQHWVRQSVGIMAAHTAFTALAGAGVAIALLSHSRRTRRLAVIAGLGTAICAHLSNNYLGKRMEWWFDLFDHPWVVNLLLTPGMLAMLQLPFVLGYVLLLRRGLREQYDALRVEVPAELGSQLGAITADEAGELLDPARRFRLHVDALRRGGPRAYRHSARGHATQLDLAMARWHVHQGHPGHSAADVDAARDRVLRLKAGPNPIGTTTAEVAR